MLKKTNFNEFTSHCFRHTAATSATEMGISVHKLQIGGGWLYKTVAKEYVDNSFHNLKLPK